MISKNNSFGLKLKMHFPDGGKYAFAFISLFIALIIIYGNSFHGEWYFDDFPNIVDNTNGYLESLSLENIVKTFYVKDFENKGIVRPLSRLTFALNYHIGGLNVFGYHLVNFAIHYVAAIFLFLFIFNALKLPILNARYAGATYAVALLSVFLWATHPLQVTAVTYIVQRMASMAGMFYITAMYLYLKARVAKTTGKQVSLFALCGISGVLSFASKENAAMLPVSLWAFDMFLIQGVTRENVKKNVKVIIFPLILLLLLGYLYVDLSTILDDYKHRPFTLGERLLTEPRVIMTYIGLLLYPTSSRLMFLHDVGISRSLLTPWTTLPAILAVVSIIGFALRIGRRRPLIAYCILFYFLNHVIEGSFIPLELIYEHTNYLPSMLFFVPVAIAVVYALDYFSYAKRLQFLMAFCAIFLLVAQGHTSYLRNGIFRDGLTFWSDNLNKAENLPRVHQGLGAALLSSGYDREGVREHEKAIAIDTGEKIHQRFRTYFNLGTYYFYHNDYGRAQEYFSRTLGEMPNYSKANNFMALIMIHRNDLSEAENYCRKALRFAPDSAESLRTLSLIRLKKGDVDNGLKIAIKAMLITGNENSSYYLLGEAYRMKNELPKAVSYFTKHIRYYPASIASHLALIELYYLLHDTEKLKQVTGRLMRLTGEIDLSEFLVDYNRNHNCLDESRMSRIVQALEETGCSRFKRLNRLLQDRAFESKKTPGPFMEPGVSVYYER